MDKISGINKEYVIGIDIGGTNFRIGSVDSQGNVLDLQRYSSYIFTQNQNPTQELIKYILNFIDQQKGCLKSICIGFPGTVTKDKTTVSSCPNIKVFDGINISALLEERFNVPVIVEHDVILLLQNDIHKYQLENLDCIIAMYLGTGLGNALYVHGRILDGKNGTSGELGHIAIANNSAVCPCGNSGCIELYASGKRLEHIRSQHYPEASSFEEMLNLHSTDQVIVEFLDYVAIALAAEINILDPDIILVGGGVINIPTFPYEELLNSVKRHVRKPFPANNISFLRIPIDEKQGVRGAGLYAWKKFM